MKPWPRLPSDPRLYYFTVPNEIFHSEINASEFAILAYLFSRQMKKLPPTNLMTVKMNLGLSRNTMKKYVRILESRGLIFLQRDKRFLRASVSMRDTITLTDALKLRVGHFFPLPNSVFSFGLSVGEIAVYGYLLYREDRESYECWPSYRTIGAALCMSRNTVMKYVHRLEEKEFIVTEPTQVRRMDGSKWNGNLKYRVRPIQSVVKRWNEKQTENMALMLLQAAGKIFVIQKKPEGGNLKRIQEKTEEQTGKCISTRIRSTGKNMLALHAVIRK